jgi:2'-5' RNA ligase
MTEGVRFIIITTPPDPVSRSVEIARARACEIGGSRAALAYPPHVTLRTGAFVPVAMVGTFINAFGAALGSWEPFTIRTEGLLLSPYQDGDREKHLVAYRIALDEPLAELNRRLLSYTPWRASNRLHFLPHLTLAFDDLDRDGFNRLKEWLERDAAAVPAGFEWTCDNVGLYRRESDSWTAYQVWRR